MTSFATNVHPESHKWGYKQEIFLLAPLAALFCILMLKMVALLVITMVS